MRTSGADSLRFAETASGYGLRDGSNKHTPWRLLYLRGSGRVEAWVRHDDGRFGWELVTTLPTDTPVATIEAVLRNMARLKLDTGD